jgi:hypothetical protein
VHPAVLWVLRPVFRYSETREAYVLRVIGNRRGPVLRPSDRGSSVARA